MRRAIAFALLALASCMDEEYEILIDNVGNEDVQVFVEADADWGGDDDDFFVIPPGGRRVVSYDSPNEVEIRIWRKSDRLTLFAASFDREDFEDDHGTIEIAVSP